MQAEHERRNVGPENSSTPLMREAFRTPGCRADHRGRAMHKHWNDLEVDDT